MDNKILFEETFKTFDEKRQKLSYDKWSQWDEEEVTTLMYDVAITARDVVLNALLEKLKSLLTEEQLKSVLDVIPELFSKKPETKPGIDKETIKQVITLYRQWQDELSDVPLVNYIQERLVSTKEGKKKFEGKKLRECNLSARAINCLYMSNVFTTSDLLYGNFSIKDFKKARNVGKVTLKEVEDFIAKLKEEEKNDN